MLEPHASKTDVTRTVVEVVVVEEEEEEEEEEETKSTVKYFTFSKTMASFSTGQRCKSSCTIRSSTGAERSSSIAALYVAVHVKRK